jgi:hypothetical protein
MVSIHSAGLHPIVSLCLAAATVLAWPAVGATQSPSVLQESSPPSASTEPVAGNTDAADLWFFDGTTLTRIDGVTGVVSGRLPVVSSDCTFGQGWVDFIEPVDGFAWLVNSDPPKPIDGPCALRVATADGAITAYSLKLDTKAEVHLSDAIPAVGSLWLVEVRSHDGRSGSGDGSLYRLDPEAGGLTLVGARVENAAATGDALVAVTSHGRGGKLRLGAATIDATTGAITPIKPPGTLFLGQRVAGGAGRAVFYNTAGGPFGVYDTATGTALASLALPKKGEYAYRPIVSADGVWLSGSLKNGQRYAELARWGAATPEAMPDPCEGNTKTCVSYLIGATPGAVWQAYGPGDAYSRPDWTTMNLRRVDAATLAPTATVAMSTVFGVGAPAASPSAAP